MPYTEFTCRSGGSNLNAGSLDGSAEAATSALYTSTGGNSGTIGYPDIGAVQHQDVAAGAGTASLRYA